MPFCLSIACRAASLALLLPLLSGCGPERNQFPPACPHAGLLDPTGDILVYRPNSSGHDLTDVVLQGRMVGINGQCRPGDKGTLDVAVKFSIEFARGPAMQGDRTQVPVFVAVTEGDRILDKHLYQVEAAFPRNVDRVRLTSAEVDLTLPVTPTKSGAAYSILAGFQLTPDQLAAERAKER